LESGSAAFRDFARRPRAPIRIGLGSL
jgi:hypothetical protein